MKKEAARTYWVRFVIALFSLLLLVGTYRLGYQAGILEERSWQASGYQPYFNNANSMHRRLVSRENLRAVGNVNIVRQVSVPLKDSYPFDSGITR